MDWLDRAYQEHAGPLIWLGVHPIYDPLREEPRFQILVQKIGVSERPNGRTKHLAAGPHE